MFEPIRVPASSAASFLSPYLVGTNAEFTKAERFGAAIVGLLNSLRGQYKTPSQRARNHQQALATQSPTKPGTLGHMLSSIHTKFQQLLRSDTSLAEFAAKVEDPELAIAFPYSRHRLPSFAPEGDASLLNELFIRQLFSGVYGTPEESVQLIQNWVTLLGQSCTEILKSFSRSNSSSLLDAIFLGSYSAWHLLQTEEVSGISFNHGDISPASAMLTEIANGVHAYILQYAVEELKVPINQYSKHLRAIADRSVTPHKIERPKENMEYLTRLSYLRLSAEKYYHDTLQHPTEDSIREALELLRTVNTISPPFHLTDIPLTLPEGRIMLLIRPPDSPPLLLMLSGPDQNFAIGTLSSNPSWPKGAGRMVYRVNDRDEYEYVLVFRKNLSTGAWMPNNPRVKIVETPLLGNLVSREDGINLTRLSNYAWGFVMGLWTKLPALFDATANFPYFTCFEASVELQPSGNKRWSIKFLGDDQQFSRIKGLIPDDWSSTIEEVNCSSSQPSQVVETRPNLGKLLGFTGIKPKEVLNVLGRLGAQITHGKGSHIKLTRGSHVWVTGSSIHSETKPMPYWAICDALRCLGIDYQDFLKECKH